MLPNVTFKNCDMPAYISNQSRRLLSGNNKWCEASLLLTSLLYELMQEAGFACSSVPNHQKLEEEI